MHLDELAYIVIGSSKRDAWRAYAVDVLGAMAEDAANGALDIKLDDWCYRIRIVPDAHERYQLAGWAVANAAAYRAALDHARRLGVAVVEGAPEDCADRKVSAVFAFVDPAGNRHEVCWGRSLDARPFVSAAGVSGFVTGKLGMGHVVLPCEGDYDAAMLFYEEVMGLNYSDFFSRVFTPGEPPRRVHFFHCRNGRQHSLAIGEFSAAGGLNHFMIEVSALDDVGRCLDRVKAGGATLARSLGRHVNDAIVSIYIVTPGGFFTEYGTGGKVVTDWSAEPVYNIPVGTYWGHEWQPDAFATAPGEAAAPEPNARDIEFRKEMPA